MQILARNAEFDVPEFIYDDVGLDYDWSSETMTYPEGKGTDFLGNLNNTCSS